MISDSLAILAAPLAFIAGVASAEIIDPVAFIDRNGAQKKRLGDDGQMVFYTSTERTNKARLQAIARAVATLPKHETISALCERTRRDAAAAFTKRSGTRVSLEGFGYSGSVIACAMLYSTKGETGRQIMFMNAARGAMYIVIVTE